MATTRCRSWVLVVARDEQPALVGGDARLDGVELAGRRVVTLDDLFHPGIERRELAHDLTGMGALLGERVGGGGGGETEGEGKEGD
jgi:hypothetical protein